MFGNETRVFLQSLFSLWAGQREAEQNFCRHESGEAWMESEQLEARAAEGKGEPLSSKNKISVKLTQYSLGTRLICNERHSNDVTNWSRSDLPGLTR